MHIEALKTNIMTAGKLIPPKGEALTTEDQRELAFEFAFENVTAIPLSNVSGIHPITSSVIFQKKVLSYSWIELSLVALISLFIATACYFGGPAPVNSVASVYSSAVTEQSHSLSSEHTEDKFISQLPGQRKINKAKKNLNPISVAKEMAPGLESEQERSANSPINEKGITTITSKAPQVVVPKSQLDIAYQIATMTGRFTLVKFGASWCTPCKMMEESTFSYQPIIDLLDAYFTTVELDIDMPVGKQAKNTFYITQVPSFIILDEWGNELRREEGAMGTSAFLEWLESVRPYINLKEEQLTTVEVTNSYAK